LSLWFGSSDAAASTALATANSGAIRASTSTTPAPVSVSQPRSIRGRALRAEFRSARRTSAVSTATSSGSPVTSNQGSNSASPT
jgi:hypothetical protein